MGIYRKVMEDDLILPVPGKPEDDTQDKMIIIDARYDSGQGVAENGILAYTPADGLLPAEHMGDEPSVCFAKEGWPWWWGQNSITPPSSPDQDRCC